ncbi:uncharacterized protein UV8b_03693 [Ustilaginoidea virens]|uniref:Uncharacterized protein n=1 Tax=Ustilaginoidea virens TaxID=1159556 RepID=A0A8E5HQ61_USTVR|nr:uncharacterized protein UV8b_03693 [Ustilaginoidea virens]QUC19452.1 hypothetical protein UV8b_03693 [Ustilaginoidea virens]
MADQAISSGSSDFKWEYANIQLCRDEVLEGAEEEARERTVTAGRSVSKGFLRL